MLSGDDVLKAGAAVHKALREASLDIPVKGGAMNSEEIRASDERIRLMTLETMKRAIWSHLNRILPDSLNAKGIDAVTKEFVESGMRAIEKYKK